MIPQLISFADFKQYKPLANSFQAEERLMACINKAQDIDLRDLLGRALYKLVLDGRETAPYYDLIHGTSYIFSGNAIDYRGLIPYLVYTAYGYLLREMQATLTISGAKIKTATESETPSEEWLANELQEVRTQASVWEKDIKDYLFTNLSEFPTYESALHRPQGSFTISVARQPNFNISK